MDEEVQLFYKQLDSIIAKTPKKDILVVQGDWNAKVGPDAYLHWAGTVGRFGIGETNDRGRRLLELAKSPAHQNKLSRTTTWQTPSGLSRFKTRQTSS